VQQDAQPEPVATVELAQIDDGATPVIDARAQAQYMHAEGMNASQIARALDANYNTVRSWLKRAQMQTNGVEHV
jgi:DNA-directed RNA polymerase specialized sigma24 family protein